MEMSRNHQEAEMAQNKCSIRIHADGEECGAPAVAHFQGRDGRDYYECDAHAYPGRAASVVDAPIEVGARVMVRHCGVDKVGQVVAVRRVLADVRVPIRNGADHRIISLPAADLARV